MNHWLMRGQLAAATSDSSQRMRECDHFAVFLCVERLVVQGHNHALRQLLLSYPLLSEPCTQLHTHPRRSATPAPTRLAPAFNSDRAAPKHTTNQQQCGSSRGLVITTTRRHGGCWGRGRGSGGGGGHSAKGTNEHTQQHTCVNRMLNSTRGHGSTSTQVCFRQPVSQQHSITALALSAPLTAIECALGHATLVGWSLALRTSPAHRHTHRAMLISF